MRSTLRLLASISRSSQYLEAGQPTGLTGLLTQQHPRSTLLYLYSSTLDKLREFPDHSVYRQSTEALTKHRMTIVESIKPAGLSEWHQRVSQLVDAHPDAFKRVPVLNSSNVGKGKEGDFNIIYAEPPPERSWRGDDDRVNAAYKSGAQLEGPRHLDEVSDRGQKLARDEIGEEVRRLRIEPEPPLTLEQIDEVEQQIGAGLIEEIIKVAEGEKELVHTLAEAKVWDDLEEKPVDGQWVYNERKLS